MATVSQLTIRSHLFTNRCYCVILNALDSNSSVRKRKVFYVSRSLTAENKIV